MTTNYNANDKTAIMTNVASAFIGLRDGSNSIADFNTMAGAMNIAAIRAESMGQETFNVFDQAKLALMDADAMYDSLKCYIFTPGGLIDLAKGVTGCADMMENSTPEQMQAAFEESQRRLARGQIAKTGVMQ